MMKRVLALFVFPTVSLIATDAFAYIGPGAGISAFGSLLALLATIVLIAVGFIWYPVKRLLRHFRANADRSSDPVSLGDADK